MTRKEFVTLTFTLIGSAAAACSSSSNSNDGGTGGSFGTGGNSSGGNGSGGNGSGGANGATCADPLPETQDADTSGHTHSVTVHASTLDMTTDQTITTSGVMNNTVGIADHMHAVVFTANDLAMLKGGGSVDVTSMLALGHTHSYRVSCGASAGAGGSSGGAGTGAAGHTGGGGHIGGGGHDGTAGSTGAAGNTGAAGH